MKTLVFGHGWIKPSEDCYDDFISPMTNPVYFEDPRQLRQQLVVADHYKKTAMVCLTSS
ncbi:MAG: hypothetical protein ACK56W_21240 [Pirellula sp.]|jgi:hypothetical protein|nr:hypothetical protein [Pirellula sp.]